MQTIPVTLQDVEYVNHQITLSVLVVFHFIQWQMELVSRMDVIFLIVGFAFKTISVQCAKLDFTWVWTKAVWLLQLLLPLAIILFHTVHSVSNTLLIAVNIATIVCKALNMILKLKHVFHKLTVSIHANSKSLINIHFHYALFVNKDFISIVGAHVPCMTQCSPTVDVTFITVFTVLPIIHVVSVSVHGEFQKLECVQPTKLISAKTLIVNIVPTALYAILV